MKTALLRILVASMGCLLALPGGLLAQKIELVPIVKPQPKVESPAATHEQVREISVLGSDGTTRLQTLCLDGEGRVLGLVAPPRSYGAPVKDGFGEIHVLT